AFLFTPLFTAALGSVRPRLYSHASAIVGTVQQVAAAAGTALFVTVMSAVAAAAAHGSSVDPEAQSGGVCAAFLVGGVLGLFVTGTAYFIRKQEDHPEDLAEAGREEPGTGLADAPAVAGT